MVPRFLRPTKKDCKIEEYHRSIKNNTSLTKSPTKKEGSLGKSVGKKGLILN